MATKRYLYFIHQKIERPIGSTLNKFSKFNNQWILMSYHEYISNMKEIQIKILHFLDKQDNIEENYENIVKFFTDHKILNNKEELKSVLYLLTNISVNHHRGPDFIDKIYRILSFLKEDIKKNFVEETIIRIFQHDNIIDKMIILFLVQNKIISIKSVIEKNRYDRENLISFYQPEMAEYVEKNGRDFFVKCLRFNFKEIPNDFYEKRKKGENDDYICKLIREDLVDEFISYVNQKSYPLNSKIEPSLYETNQFLLENKPNLIQYAAFFGSVQIFKYLYKNGVKLNTKLWLYGIHGDNPEIISILEEEKIEPYYDSKNNILSTSIKCHHIDTANYMLNELLDEKDISSNLKNNFDNNIYSFSFKYYNFSFFPDEINNNFIIFYACIYDYSLIVSDIFKMKSIDLNIKIIYIVVIQSNFYKYSLIIF